MNTRSMGAWTITWLAFAALLTACDENAASSGAEDASYPNDALWEGDMTETGTDACNPVVRSFPILPSGHISPAAYNPAVYNSNPPSSGPHCNNWGQYATFVNQPLPRCNYIHNLEHGAVALLYKCPNGCPQIQAAFADLVANFQDAAMCSVPRLVVTADPDLESKVAASAWGATFTASCLDAPALASLKQFMRDHHNRAPEKVCAGGGVAP